MAYTRALLRAAIQQRCDIENATAQTTSELNDRINDAAKVTHDFLIGTFGERYGYAASTLSTIAGQSLYTIGTGSSPLVATGFYRPIAFKLRVDGISYPLSSFQLGDTATFGGAAGTGTARSWGSGSLPRYALQLQSDSSYRLLLEPPPDAVQSVEIIYHIGPPQYSADGDSVAIPHVDLLIVEACLLVKDKEERDTSRFERERAQLRQAIQDWAAPIDTANPAHTQRVARNYSFALWRRGRLF